MHLVFGALPDVDDRPPVSGDVLVIGIGNDFRRDDGVGLVVAAEIAARHLPGVRVINAIGEPAAILDAWTGTTLTVAVDATMGDGSSPGTIRRWTPGDGDHPAMVSSHAFGLPQTYALGAAVGQIPQTLVVFTVDIADAGHGVGLTPSVAAAVPEVIDVILGEIAHSS